MKKLCTFVMTAILSLAGIFADGLSVEQIMAKYDANDNFETCRMKATLSVTDKFGTTKTSFESCQRKNGDTLIIVADGPDAGQKILRLENSVYLYYPDAEELIRLQGSALKDSIMGSDFSYEDLTGSDSTLENYTGELLGKETIDGFECYHLMLTAKTKKQLYQKQELWIDCSMFVGRKEIMYSASGKALSESVMTEFKKFGRYYIGTKGRMVNLLKKSSVTEMNITFIEFDVPLSDKLFSKDELAW
ncbi:MAG: outer membrane lipoprotein-sorting protein [Treponema sp.]